MLRIHPSTGAQSAKTYFTQALNRSDYYRTSAAEVSRWQGKAAHLLGIAGEPVTPESFGALAENRDPRSGERLTARDRHDRLSGWDFTFSVPKSASVLSEIRGDTRIRAALIESVAETMAEIEQRVMTRVRRGGASEDRITGNFVYAPFLHDTTRPIDGIPDPHLHCHCYVFNSTLDEVERKYKAAKIRSIKREAAYSEAVFLSRFATKCQALGYRIFRRGKSFELGGVSDSIIRRFSRRTAEIEAMAVQFNIQNPEIKAMLGARTRKRKNQNLSPEQVAAGWRSRLSPSELPELARAREHGGLFPQTVTPADAISHSLNHHLERCSVVATHRLLETALRFAPGQFSPEALNEALHARTDLYRMARDEQVFVTSQEIIVEEQEVIDFARSGVGSCEPLDLGTPWAIQDAKLNRGQRAAVNHVLTSTNRVLLIRGGAGTGKTTLLKEATTALHARGHRVLLLAPTADASRGVLRSEGFVDADTIEKFLGDTIHQMRAAGGVLWIDEAGLVGTRTLRKVFHIAHQLRARVVLMGDPKQHAPQERGDAMRLLIREAGLLPAEVLEVMRQREKYKAMVEAMSAGTIGIALAKLEAMGAIVEAESDIRYPLLARDYADAIQRGRSCLAISPTHYEGGLATDAIRKELKSRELLGGVDHELTRYRDARLTTAEREDFWNYEPGMMVEFHRSVIEDNIGWRPREMFRVVGHDLWGNVVVETTDPNPRSRPLPLNRAGCFKVYHTDRIAVASGDLLRITRNGWTANGKDRLNNGSIVQVAAISPRGDIVLTDRRVISKDFRHFTHGYVSTSHAAQGRTCDVVLLCQSSHSLAAASREQLYVSVSRGREAVRVYTDDKQSLWEAAERLSERLSAAELVADRPNLSPNMQHAVTLQRRRIHERARRSQASARPAARLTHGR